MNERYHGIEMRLNRYHVNIRDREDLSALSSRQVCGFIVNHWTNTVQFQFYWALLPAYKRITALF